MFKLKSKFYILIFLTFIGFTIIGTLSHEFGHIAVAKYLGYKTELSYGSMIYHFEDYPEEYLKDENYLKIQDLFKDYKDDEILPNFIIKQYEKLNKQLEEDYPDTIRPENDDFLITLGGPMQTVITSCIGLYILWKRKSKDCKKFNILDWFGVFLGLFILREIYNTISALLSVVILNENKFYGDEFNISRYFEFNQWVAPIVSTLIGSIIVYYIIFKVIPKKYRFSFIISGFIGGLFGYFIWFKVIGPIVLP